MIAILLASAALDPLVLNGLLNLVASVQVDTKYKHLFIINFAIGVLAIAAALVVLPIDEDYTQAQIALATLFAVTVGLLSLCTNVSVLRSILTSALFFAYKATVAWALIQLLATFGLLIWFEGIELESLGDVEPPELVRWLLENGLWFRSE